jgi:hypothetical protein
MKRYPRQGTGPFDDPTPLPDGREFVTLEDAVITKLSKAEHEAPEWRAAAEALLLVATKGGPTMLARVGVMRALTATSGACSNRRAKSIIGNVASSRATDDTRYLRDLPTVVPSRELASPLIGPGMPMRVVVPSVS